MSLIAIVIVVGLVAGFSASVALLLRRLFPRITPGWRRIVAPAIGALMTMGPGIAAALRDSHASVIQVTLLAAVLALVAGYPAVRFFDTPPKS